MTISNSEIKNFLDRVETLLPILCQEKIINTPTRALFFTEVMGLSKEVYKNWYSSGIRETHKKHLSLLEDKYLPKKITYHTEEIYMYSDEELSQ